MGFFLVSALQEKYNVLWLKNHLILYCAHILGLFIPWWCSIFISQYFKNILKFLLIYFVEIVWMCMTEGILAGWILSSTLFLRPDLPSSCCPENIYQHIQNFLCGFWVASLFTMVMELMLFLNVQYIWPFLKKLSSDNLILVYNVFWSLSPSYLLMLITPSSSVLPISPSYFYGYF